MGLEIRNSLCEMQGKLFQLSAKSGYDSESFIHTFMKSKIAKDLDSTFDFMQWAGKEYILERMEDEYPDGCLTNGFLFNDETLYWTGYVYRYWHFYTGESSKEIYKQANANIMNTMYLGYHTLDVEMAIDKLKEDYSSKHKQSNNPKKYV